MASRREWRVPFGATVRVLGTARSGQPYSGTAQTIDISRRGVRLGNAEFMSALANVVTLQYQQRRAKFRVVWVGEQHGSERGLAGLQLLEGQSPIWGLDPGTGKPDTFDVAKRREAAPTVPVETPQTPPARTAVAEQPTGPERRSMARYLCDRSVACWRAGIAVPVWGKLHDLSRNGCRIEAPVVFDVGTDLRVVLLVYGMKVRAAGVVRRSADKMMGVQLTGIHRDDYAKLQSVLTRLAQPQQQASVPVNISDALLREIEAWFGDSDVLSRGQLQEVLENAKKRSETPDAS